MGSSPEKGVDESQSVSKTLEQETRKWLALAEARLQELTGDDSYIENAKAYVVDTCYFLKKGDVVRAFEAVIWAWAWMEIGERVGVLKGRPKSSASEESNVR